MRRRGDRQSVSVVLEAGRRYALRSRDGAGNWLDDDSVRWFEDHADDHVTRSVAHRSRVGGMALAPSGSRATPSTWWMARPPSSNPTAEAAM